MTILPSGARAYVDGRDIVIVRAAFPKGSVSLNGPHYVVDFVDGDTGVKVAMRRVGVKKARAVQYRGAPP